MNLADRRRREGLAVDASAGNRVAVKEGAVEIEAAENTFAHIERRLDADFVRASCATTLWQEWTTIDQALVDAVHAAGIQVIAWTVNDPAAAARLARMGVDGLCGNYPDRLEVPA